MALPDTIDQRRSCRFLFTATDIKKLIPTNGRIDLAMAQKGLQRSRVQPLGQKRIHGPTKSVSVLPIAKFPMRPALSRISKFAAERGTR